MKAVIIAGGLGIRMGELGRRVPKALLEVGGRTILEHSLRALAESGVEEVFLCTSHLQHLIRDEVLNLQFLKLKPVVVCDIPPKGTAGAVRAFRGKLRHDFFVLYGDVLAHMDFEPLFEYHRLRKAIATLVVHPNDHPVDSDLVEVDAGENVTAIWSKHSRLRERYYSNLVNAAVYVLSPRVMDFIPADRPSDFGQEVFPAMVAAGVFPAAYRTAEYIKDVGTAERLREVREDWEKGMVNSRNSRQARPAVFLDRDGVINREQGHISRPEDFELLPRVAQAIRRLNRSGYLVVVVSNQPVVARGELDEEGLREIERKMEWLLGQEGAYIDRTYYCLHHPDAGFPGERLELKGTCECRKPETGLIRRATAELNIDLKGSWLVGDTTSDLQTGINAGVRTLLLETGYGGRDGKFRCTPDASTADLGNAVDFILSDSRINRRQ